MGFGLTDVLKGEIVIYNVIYKGWCMTWRGVCLIKYFTDIFLFVL